MTATPVIQTFDETDLNAAEHLTHTYHEMTQQLSRVIVGHTKVLCNVIRFFWGKTGHFEVELPQDRDGWTIRCKASSRRQHS